MEVARGRRLAPKQAAFVREYLLDLNATQAAIRAGYSQRSAKQRACELLQREDVQAAIQAAMARREQIAEDSAVLVLRDIRRLQGIAEEAGKLTEAIKCCELRGKHVGMWPNRITLDGKIEVRQKPDLSQLSAEELDQLERLLGKVPDPGRGSSREGQA